MIIPGFLITFITFPGVIIHELAHQIFCMLCGLEIYEVKYFRPMKNPSGYVIHASSDRPFHVFLTSMGPFFVNTILGILILLPASVELLIFKEYTNPMNLLLGWLGISILMHAFPSTGDAKVMVERILKNPDVSLVWKVLAAPFIGLIYLCAAGSIFWLDLGYALAVGMLVPNLLVMIL